MSAAPVRPLFHAIVVVALALVIGKWAHAAPGPGYQWRTISTRHCDVHFHLEAEQEARRMSALCDEAIEISSAILRSAPREKTQLVVHDTDDRANGFARTVPMNHVSVLTIAPDARSDLSHTEDHLRLLLVHEMFHVVHLETYSGVPEYVNRFLGKSWPPNLLQPRFVVEGLAVYTESRFTDGGRLRSERFRAPLRMAALEGDLWSLDDLANNSRRPPSGTAAYLYGGAFMGFLAQRHGDAFVSAHAKEFGGHLIPFAVARAFDTSANIDLSADYEAFLDDLREEAAAIRARIIARGGPSPVRRLTRVGGSVGAPRFDSSGSLTFSADPPNGVPGFWRIDGLPDASPSPVAVLAAPSPSGMVRLDDGTFVLGHAEVNNGALSFHDLFLIDARGNKRPLTRGARMRDPFVMPGSHAVVAERRSGHESAVSLVDVATGTWRDLVIHTDGTQAFSPRPSPDGSVVVYSRLAIGGRRTLVEIDVSTGAERELSPTNAEDLDPSFTPDGRTILFSSNRGHGIFNIHALDRATGRVFRVTDTLGLAKEPIATPDGNAVVYVDVTLGGHDLFVTPLVFVDDGDSAPPPAVVHRVDVDDQPDTLYNPLPTLLPRVWQPTLDSDVTGSPSMGLVLSGEDAVGLIRWSLQGAYGVGQMRPRASFSLRLDGPFIPLAASGDWFTNDTLILADRDELAPRRQTVLRMGVEAGLPIRRLFRSHSLSVGYGRSLYIDEGAPIGNPDGAMPRLPPPSHIGEAIFSWSYSDIRRFRDSVSSEIGQSAYIRLEAANGFTLSPLNLYEILFGARVFRPVPFFPRHVVALNLEGGFAQGERARRSNFRLGGISGRDFTRDLVAQVRFGDGVLRGYPANVDVGDAYYVGNLEYRLPILEVERGVDSLPLQLNRVQAAAFVDVGDAFDGVPYPSSTRASVGAELQIRVVVAYYGHFFLRVGYARGLMAAGVHQPYFVLGVPL